MKRILAVGCSHGSRSLPKALEAVLCFRQEFKPHTVIHLGDAYDTAAFRAGAEYGRGDPDEADDIGEDIRSAKEFLRELYPSVFCFGNHEARLAKMAHHPSAIKALAASQCLSEITAALPRKCRQRPWTVWDNWEKIGNYRFGHGFQFGEQFLRDSAETYGNCVVAHAHRAGEAQGRTLEPSRAICVGTLADIPAMTYAEGRRSTLSWSHGFVWGEYNDKEARLHLHHWPRGETIWAIPS